MIKNNWRYINIFNFIFILLFSSCVLDNNPINKKKKILDDEKVSDILDKPASNSLINHENKVYHLTDYDARPLIQNGSGKYYTTFDDYHNSNPTKYKNYYSDHSFEAIKKDIFSHEYSNIVIIVPAGTYLLKNLISFDFSNYIYAKKLKFSIIGDGVGTSRIFSENDQGVIRVILNKAGSANTKLEISNLSLTATKRVQGTAIKLITNNKMKFEVNNVEIEGNSVFTTCFNKGIDAKNTLNPIVRYTTIKGLHEKGEEGKYSMKMGVDLSNSIAPLMEFSQVWNADIGLNLDNISSDKTYLSRLKSNFLVGVNIGIVLYNRHNDEKLDLVIDNGHINYYKKAIWIYKYDSIKIESMLFYANDRKGSIKPGGSRGVATDNSPTDIDLSQTKNTSIVGNIFTEASDPKRTAIHIGRYSSNVKILSNQFNNEGNGIRNISVNPHSSLYNMFGGKDARNWGPDRKYDDRTGKLNHINDF